MNNKNIVVKSHDINLDPEYTEWLIKIKESYRNTQIRSAIRVNAEMLLFNWFLGRELALRKTEERWGSGIVEQVSLDLQKEFPQARGFSTTNLWNMKKWYLFYTADSEKLHQLGGELLGDYYIAQIEQKSNISIEKLHQLGGETGFPELFAAVPWRHHVEIITKCKTIEEAFFYIKQTVKNNWSRNALDNCIRADMYQKAGKAVTNFEEKLPSIEGKLAQELLKENYDLGFISLPQEYDERGLEDAVEQQMTRFLLELGSGWAFVGRQKELVISGKTRKIDLLFYHIYLRCYVVLELKVTSFDPEFAGKLNFYVNAVDKLIKRDSDNRTIGLLICKDMDRTEVQLAFDGITTPMGVATYDNVKIKEIEEHLPTAEQIQRQIEIAEEDYKRRRHQKTQEDDAK